VLAPVVVVPVVAVPVLIGPVVVPVLVEVGELSASWQNESPSAP
jgi:hypothetical protein